MNPRPNPSNPSPDPPARLAEWQAAFEAEFDRRLSLAAGTPSRLREAMRYSGLAGGKRMRPMLVYAAAVAIDQEPARLHAVACAIEAIHAYSLIHDDLPAMDDDDMRRGRPTSHRAFDEATAILAGDALQALAFELLASDPTLAQSPGGQVRLIGALASACGAAGMAGGQMLDLSAVDRDISYDDLERMHRLKTGALIRASATAAAVFASSSADWHGRLERFGDHVGLAFQIHDDILDVTACSSQTGKPAQADAARNKPTFPSVIGLDASRERARQLVAAAQEELAGLPGDTTILAWLAQYVIARES